MLDYQLTDESEGAKTFAYYVEGDRSMSGEVAISMADGQCTVTELAPNDKFSRYANHLANALERYYSAGSLKPAGTIMWY